MSRCFSAGSASPEGRLSDRAGRDGQGASYSPKFCIGVIGELAGDDRPLPGEEQRSDMLREVADLIGGEQRAGRCVAHRSDMPDFVEIERPAHRSEHNGFLSEKIEMSRALSSSLTPKTCRTPAFDRKVPARWP